MKTLADIYGLMDSHDDYKSDDFITTNAEVDKAERELAVSFGSQFRELMLSKVDYVSGGSLNSCKRFDNCDTIVEKTREEWMRKGTSCDWCAICSKNH